MHSERVAKRRPTTVAGTAGLAVVVALSGACAAAGTGTGAPAAAPATGTATSAPGSSAPAAAATFREEKVDIDGATVSISCAGTGPKTVVFVSGLGEDAATTWGRSGVPQAIAAETRTCMYDRPGLGASSAVTTPRTVTAHVAELGALLDKGAVTAPVVLVAQGYGTFIARQFAKDRVRSVAGVVLVDPPLNELHPALPPGATAGQQAEYASIPDLNANLGAFGAGALPPPPAPSIVLGAGPLPALPPDAPIPAPPAAPGTVVRDAHISEGQNQLARKSPFGSFQLVSDAGSYIQYWKPAAVTAAIRSVVDDTRGGR